MKSFKKTYSKDFSNKSCVCCDNTQSKIYRNNSLLGFPVIVCPNCGLYSIYGKEEQIKNKTEDVYNKKYWDERKAKDIINSNFKNHDSLMKKSRWESEKEFCEPFISEKKSILEIGSGAGQNLYFFQKMGFNVTGIEPDKNNVNLINQMISPEGICHQGYIETFDIDKKVDVVWMSHVLEHVLDLNIVFKKICNILNKSGLFFVEVPNCECYNMVNSSFDENPSTYGFTKKSLNFLGEKYGFKEIKSGYYNTHLTFSDKWFRRIKKYGKINFNFLPFHYIETSSDKGNDLRVLFKI